MDALQEKQESRAENTSRAETATVESPAIEASESAEAAQEDAVIDESPEEVKAEKKEIPEDVKKRIMGGESFMDKLKANQEKKAQDAEAFAEEEQEAENFEEADQEVEAKQEESEADKPKFTIGEETFESIEQVNEHVATIQNEKAELQKEVEEIRSFVEKVSDPDTIEILRYVMEGHSLRVAMVKAGLDESIFQVEHGDEDAESLVEAKLERKKAIAEQKKQQEILQKNMQRTNTELEELQKEEGFDDKVKEQLIKAMSDFHTNGLNGLIPKESMKLFLKAINYEKAIQKAEEKGTIKGRNEKIVIEKQRKKGDEIPQLGRGVTSSDKVRKPSRLQSLVNVPASSFMERLQNKN